MRFVLPFMAALLAAHTAHAHIVASPDHGAAGSYFQTSLRVAHGCDKGATTQLHVKIPAGVLSVHPQAKPGWTVKIITRRLDQPVAVGHGKTVDEAVTDIIWSGNVLPADQYDDFGMLMKLPEAAGQTLWFPVTQICKSDRVDWAEIPGKGEEWHMLHAPAPFVRVTAAN